MDNNTPRTFRTTFKLCSFFLTIACMYPHPETNKRRLWGLAFIILSMGPLIVYVLTDIYVYFINGDITSLLRHTILAGPFFGGLLKDFSSFVFMCLDILRFRQWIRLNNKIIITCINVNQGYAIINEIDRDYATYRELPKSYKDVIEKFIKNSQLKCELFWTLNVVIAILLYPLVSAYVNAKSLLFDENPRRYLMHDMNILFTEPDFKYSTPFFEIFFTYCLYAAVLFILLFVGYDSFFAISVDHACLKIIVYCKKFEDALLIKNKIQRFNKIVEVIEDQKRCYEFVDLIQYNFNLYLGIILFATLLEIGTCFYQFTASGQFDPQFLALTILSVGGILLPCHYAAKLKDLSEVSATTFYCAGWENINCISTRKMILFMIARQQVPITLKGFNCITFDMELFVTILRSAYSIYTLLTS